MRSIQQPDYVGLTLARPGLAARVVRGPGPSSAGTSMDSTYGARISV